MILGIPGSVGCARTAVDWHEWPLGDNLGQNGKK